MTVFPESPEVDDTYTVNGREFIYDASGRWMPNWGGGSGVEALPTFSDIGNAGSSKTVTVTDADVQSLTLNSATLTLTLSGTPASGEVNWMVLRLVHDNTTSSRTVVWPAAMLWENDTEPFLPTTDADAISTFSILTLSDGTRIGYHTGNFFP